MTDVKAANNRKRVLVVDDQPKVLRFMEIDLKLHGFEVMTATSGEQALEIFKATSPDILLLDIIMPGIGGFETLKQVRTFSKLPVIAFSASIANHDLAIRLGANYFMPKPFKVQDLLKKIDHLLSNSN